MKAQVIQFGPNGSAVCLWTDAIDLAVLGDLTVRRASAIEFNNARGLWQVTINGIGVPSFEASSREACIHWEVKQLNDALLKGRV